MLCCDFLQRLNIEHSLGKNDRIDDTFSYGDISSGALSSGESGKSGDSMLIASIAKPKFTVFGETPKQYIVGNSSAAIG